MRWSNGLIAACAVPLAALAVGWAAACGAGRHEQTLPAPHSCVDDVQYFRPGPELLLADEAAALEEYLQTRRELQP